MRSMQVITYCNSQYPEMIHNNPSKETVLSAGPYHLHALGDRKGKVSSKGRRFSPPQTHALYKQVARNTVIDTACLPAVQWLNPSNEYQTVTCTFCFQLDHWLPRVRTSQHACCSMDLFQRGDQARSNPFSNKLKSLLSVKTLCLLSITSIRRETSRGKWENVLISTSPAYKLLFLPMPVIYQVSPSPGELVGGGAASPVPCRSAAELPSHPDPCKRASNCCDAAARPVHTATSQHQCGFNLLCDHFRWIAALA